MRHDLRTPADGADPPPPDRATGAAGAVLATPDQLPTPHQRALRMQQLIDASWAAHGRTVVLAVMGLPGSGKSSSVRALLALDERVARLNLDDLRALVRDGQMGGDHERKLVLPLQAAMLDAMLGMGLRAVVVDNTNLSARAGRRLQAIVGTRGQVVIDTQHLEVPLEVCLARNAQRQGRARVPDHVIRRMHDQLRQRLAGEQIEPTE